MKLSTILAGGLLASSAAAYRISLYSENNYQGKQASYSSAGAHTVPFTTKSWIWSSTPGDGCCVAFCHGSTNVGRYCGGTRKPDSSAGVNKVVTGCGNAVLNC